MKTILLLRENDKTHYIIDILARKWTAAGCRVINHIGLSRLPDADIVFLHVDRTVVPEDYEVCASKYPMVINGKVLNISRASYSMAKLEKNCQYAGPVIVKTNDNYGGLPERRYVSALISTGKKLFRKPYSKVWRQILSSWQGISFLDPLEYPIFNHITDVPSGVWENNHLIVEKFLPEREDDLFFVRYWTFLGDKNITGRYGSLHPIAKFHRCVTEVMPVDIPEELVLCRKKMNMDYGRFDYVMHDGKPVLLDINKTQAAGRLSGQDLEQLAFLSTGIEFYLR